LVAGSPAAHIGLGGLRCGEQLFDHRPAYTIGFADTQSFCFSVFGPTAYLFFFNPLAESSTPRNAVLGHSIGLLCGFAAYKITSMHAFPEGFGGEVYWPRILASALALSLTGAVMILLRVNHPPAGATTMIVALGILAKPGYLPVIEIAVVLLTAQAYAINRLAGLPYPIWQGHRPQSEGIP
jgi:CBS domain-containing membrane protein